MAKTETIKKWELKRGHLVGYAVGVPCYEDTGDTEYIWGTNKEANAKARELDAKDEPGYGWSVYGFVAEI